MKICIAKNNIQRNNGTNCTVTEIPIDTHELNIALAEINGRYPETGCAVNHKVSELVYIQSGTGSLTVGTDTINFEEGDSLLIEPNEPFYWHGKFSAVIACSPAFTVEQHEHIENEISELL